MTIRKLAAITLVLFPATGCASLSEAELERRQYQRATYKAEFLDYRDRCTLRGKRIWISARGKVGRDGLPAPGDVYYCG